MKLQELITECNKAISLDIMLYELIFDGDTLCGLSNVEHVFVDHEKRQIIMTPPLLMAAA